MNWKLLLVPLGVLLIIVAIQLNVTEWSTESITPPIAQEGVTENTLTTDKNSSPDSETQSDRSELVPGKEGTHSEEEPGQSTEDSESLDRDYQYAQSYGESDVSEQSNEAHSNPLNSGTKKPSNSTGPDISGKPSERPPSKSEGNSSIESKPTKPNKGSGSTMTETTSVFNKLPEGAFNIQDNTDFDTWGTIVRKDKLPAGMQDASHYTITVGDLTYDLVQNKYDKNVYNGEVSSLEHSREEIEKGFVKAVK